MKNISKMEKTRALTRILERINRGANPKVLCKEASNLFPGIQPIDIATAEQNLVDAGYSPHLVRQLSSAFVLIAMLKKQHVNLRRQLPAGHILRRVMGEHELIRCFIVDLAQVEGDIQEKQQLCDRSSEIRRLAHIARHLDAMEEHIAREEDVIFPCLKQHGWQGLCRSVCCEHTYVRIAISDLLTIIETFNRTRFTEFKAKLSSITGYLCPTITEHIFQEDNILFPIATEIISDTKVWDRVKNLCEEIGYCGLHV